MKTVVALVFLAVTASSLHAQTLTPAQQYARATQFASAGPTVQLKLNHVRQLFEAMAANSAPAAGNANATGTSPGPSGAAPKVVKPR